jgi:hypothetical protein
MNTLCITVFESVEYLSFLLLSNVERNVSDTLSVLIYSSFDRFILFKKIIIIIFYYNIVCSIL